METNIVTQLDFCKQWQVQVWCIQVPFESIRSLWSANKSVTLLVLEINRSNRIRSIDLLPNSLYLMISSPLETFVVASMCVSVVVSASVASCKCVSNDQWWCCLSPSWSLGELSSLENNHHSPGRTSHSYDLKTFHRKHLLNTANLMSVGSMIIGNSCCALSPTFIDPLLAARQCVN